MLNAPPSSVRVLGRPMRIKLLSASRLPDVCGQFEPTKNIISIHKDMPLAELQDTVLHEILHAVLYMQGRENGGDVEELFVRALATGLLGVLHDNPELPSWLLCNNGAPP